jgi:hypothetical protein
MSPLLLVISWSLVTMGLALAIRLARSAWNAHSTPEALLAAFFAAGCLAYALLLCRPTFDLSLEAFEPLRSVAAWAFAVPFVTVSLFTWQVFRRDSRAARAAAITIAVLGVAVLALGAIIAPALQLGAAWTLEPGTPVHYARLVISAAAFAWASVEAARYYWAARKRTRIGLLDPLIANRFLLWAVWSGSALTLLGLRALHQAMVDPALGVTIPSLAIAQMFAGLVCAMTVWLTFAAPSFYRNMVRGGAPA